MSRHYFDEKMDSLYQAGKPVTQPCKCFIGDSNDLSKQYWVDAGCEHCNGTGRVPHEGEPEIEVHWTDGGLFPQTRGWHWRRVGDEWSSERGPSDTEPEVRAAAREALK